MSATTFWKTLLYSQHLTRIEVIGKLGRKKVTETRKHLLPTRESGNVQGCSLAYRTVLEPLKEQWTSFWSPSRSQMLWLTCTLSSSPPRRAQNIEVARSVLTLLQVAGEILKLKIRELFTSSIHYQGHIINQIRWKIWSQTSDALRNLKPGKTVKKLEILLQIV